MKHRTILHRPMAFMGAFTTTFHDTEDDKTIKKKILQGDHCLSEFNLKSSEWPDSKIIKENTFDSLERLNSDVRTDGINLVLEWKTGDDLDLHAKCACDGEIWTDSPFNIECTDCHMARDVDMRTGKDGRFAVEHIFFKKPLMLIDKEIGAYVENHLPVQEADREEVDFTLYALNRYGVVIWPVEKVKDVDAEEWMRVGMSNGDTCAKQRFIYTKEMDTMGIIGFEEKLEQITEGECGWDISEANAVEAKNDDDYKKYKDSWQVKWDLVKEDICGKGWDDKYVDDDQ